MADGAVKADAEGPYCDACGADPPDSPVEICRNCYDCAQYAAEEVNAVGRMRERERIAAWLRTWQPGFLPGSMLVKGVIDELAEQIEKGEHAK